MCYQCGIFYLILRYGYYLHNHDTYLLYQYCRHFSWDKLMLVTNNSLILTYLIAIQIFLLYKTRVRKQWVVCIIYNQLVYYSTRLLPAIHLFHGALSEFIRYQTMVFIHWLFSKSDSLYHSLPSISFIYRVHILREITNPLYCQNALILINGNIHVKLCISWL
jgi:hypothetical protein